MKKLIEKRNALIAEFDAIKGKLEAEQRSAFDNTERERVNAIKIEIEDLDNQIAVEKDFEAKRNTTLDNISFSTPKATNLVTEFRSFLTGGNFGEKFKLPFEAVEQRATVTTSTNAQFGFVNQHAGLSIANSELVLPQLGVQTYYFTEGGAMDFPSISQMIGTFGSEDSSVSDQTLTSAKKTLTPTFVSASIEVSKVFLANSKEKNIADLMAQLKLAVDKALEKRTIDTFSTLTEIASGATSVSTTFHNASIQMEKALVGRPTGYVFSANGIARAKNAKVDAGSGILVYKDGMINGYPAMRSTLQTNANHGYLIDAGAVAQAYWGDLSVEIITDATLARKGNVLLIASALADGSYLDANRIAVIKNVDKLS